MYAVIFKIKLLKMVRGNGIGTVKGKNGRKNMRLKRQGEKKRGSHDNKSKKSRALGEEKTEISSNWLHITSSHKMGMLATISITTHIS